MGYQKYDRRKKHIRELDEKAAAILAAQGAVSGAESEGAAACNFSGGCDCNLVLFARPSSAQLERRASVLSSAHTCLLLVVRVQGRMRAAPAPW